MSLFFNVEEYYEDAWIELEWTRKELAIYKNLYEKTFELLKSFQLSEADNLKAEKFLKDIGYKK